MINNIALFYISQVVSGHYRDLFTEEVIVELSRDYSHKTGRELRPKGSEAWWKSMAYMACESGYVDGVWLRAEYLRCRDLHYCDLSSAVVAPAPPGS